MDTLSDLFRFSGRIGRRPLWLTFVIGSIVLHTLPKPVPMTVHEISWAKGFDRFTYETPAGSLSLTGWILMVAYVSAIILIYWAMTAAMTKRLRDRGRSAKWLALLVGGITLQAVLGWLLDKLSFPFQQAIDMALLAPIALLGLWLMAEMVLLPTAKPTANAPAV